MSIINYNMTTSF